MKKIKNLDLKTLILTLLIILFFAVLSDTAMAVDYKVANQITLTWAVTAPNNAGEKIEYSIWMAPHDDKAAATKIYTGPDLEYTVTLTDEGYFLFGLETLRMVEVTATPGTYEVVSSGGIGWSDDIVVAPVPFGVRHYLPPAAGGGFGTK